MHSLCLITIFIIEITSFVLIVEIVLGFFGGEGGDSSFICELT